MICCQTPSFKSNAQKKSLKWNLQLFPDIHLQQCQLNHCLNLGRSVSLVWARWTPPWLTLCSSQMAATTGSHDGSPASRYRAIWRDHMDDSQCWITQPQSHWQCSARNWGLDWRKRSDWCHCKVTGAEDLPNLPFMHFKVYVIINEQKNQNNQCLEQIKTCMIYRHFWY